MTISDARVALRALAHLEVDPELPEQMRADGVDDATVCAVSHAVELVEVANAAAGAAAEAQDQADAASGAADPDDQSTVTAAAVAQAVATNLAATAASLQADAHNAACDAGATMDRRHGPMEEAVGDAGGSTRVARPVWYDR